MRLLYSEVSNLEYKDFIKCAFLVNCKVSDIGPMIECMPLYKRQMCSDLPIWSVYLLKYSILYKNMDIFHYLLDHNKEFIFDDDFNIFKYFESVFMDDLTYFIYICNSLLKHNMLYVDGRYITKCIKIAIGCLNTITFMESLIHIIEEYNKKNPHIKFD
jgi:hypothetical protein